MERESLKIEDLRPHFFKIIYGEDVKQHLRIPPAFMKHLPQQTPNRAILTGPSGSHWRVRVSMDKNGTYIQKGWKEFMKENNLGDKEFLTFRYDGNMQFYVKIFNKSGVIRPATPVSNTNNVKRGRGRPRKFPVGSLDIHKQELHGPEEGLSQSTPKKKTVDSLDLHKQQLHGSEEGLSQSTPRKRPVDSLDLHKQHLHGSEEGLSQSTPRKKPVDSLDLHKQQPHGSEEGPCQSPMIGKMAKTSTSQSLRFMASMTRSNVETSFILRMPRSFSVAAQFPPLRSKVVLRDSAGKAFDVILLYDRGGHYFSGGWVSFARHNHLKIGDVCIFELVNVDEMRVHVL